MPATTRHQRVKKALHLFDLPRETLLLILQREDVTATDLARFSCVSKGEKAREIAMEAAKNRVKSAWPESELNYKTEEDRERRSDLRRQLGAGGWLFIDALDFPKPRRVAAGENDNGVDDENDASGAPSSPAVRSGMRLTRSSWPTRIVAPRARVCGRPRGNARGRGRGARARTKARGFAECDCNTK